MRRSIWLLAVAVLGLGGCLLKPFTPVPSPDYTVEERWAVLDTDSLTLFVRPQAYSGDARSVASSFFTLFLQVKNKSAQPLSLSRGDFSVTVNQQQFDHIPLSIVLGSLQSGYYLDQYDDPFEPVTPELQDQALERARTQYFELVNSYFSFGDILPGGMKQGYLFYDHRIGGAQGFEFNALGASIRYLRR